MQYIYKRKKEKKKKKKRACSIRPILKRLHATKATKEKEIYILHGKKRGYG